MPTALSSVSLDMAKKKPEDEGKDKQVAFRIPMALYIRLEAAARGLGLDNVSPLLRMMVRQSLPRYEREADEIRRQEGTGA